MLKLFDGTLFTSYRASVEPKFSENTYLTRSLKYKLYSKLYIILKCIFLLQLHLQIDPSNIWFFLFSSFPNFHYIFFLYAQYFKKKFSWIKAMSWNKLKSICHSILTCVVVCDFLFYLLLLLVSYDYFAHKSGKLSLRVFQTNKR